MTSMQQNIICRANSATSVETLPEYSHPVVIKKPLKRLSIPAETTRYPHMRSRPGLPGRFINIGCNTLYLHGKLRLIAYALVFLHASFAAFFLNAGFAHAQNTIQVSESAQEPEKPQISLTPAEGALAQQAPLKKNVLVLHGLWRIRTYEIPFNSSLHDALLADKAVRAGITHVYTWALKISPIVSIRRIA